MPAALALVGMALATSCSVGQGAITTTEVPGGTTQAMVTTTLGTAAPAAATTTTAATTTSLAPETTTVPAWWRAVTAHDPLRLWVIGDSLAGTVGRGLTAQGSATGVVMVTVDYANSTGLVRPDFFDWPAFVEEHLPEVRPEAVVVLLGANDGQGITTPQGRLEYGTSGWDDAYRSLVGGFMDQLLAGAARVYWVGLPVMEDAGYDAKVRHLNALHLEEADQHPGVVVIEAYELFQGPGGGYAPELPGDGGTVVVRLADGIHYTEAGGAVLAGRVLDVIAGEWQLTDPAG